MAAKTTTAEYKMDTFRMWEGDCHPAIYKKNKKGEWDYLFIVSSREEGEKYLKDHSRIEREYFWDRALIWIFFVIPASALLIWGAIVGILAITGNL
jgi:hypothetical protein